MVSDYKTSGFCLTHTALKKLHEIQDKFSRENMEKKIYKGYSLSKTVERLIIDYQI